MPIATIDPTTGETVKVFDALSDKQRKLAVIHLPAAPTNCLHMVAKPP